MMKATSFSSHARTQHGFGRVSILWFASAVSIAVSKPVMLTTISQVAAKCGENVTLTCDANSSGQKDIISLSWLDRNKSVCQYEDGKREPEPPCEVTARPRHQRLTLTLPNVMPVDQGQYLCKLRSTLGPNSSTTVVTVQDCFKRHGSFINESHAKCWFSGVYPTGTVYWFQGDVNLTDTASTWEEMDDRGRYNVLSKIDVHKGNLSQPYKCSLWIPSTRKMLSSQQLPLVRKQIGSSGSLVKLQWVCVLVEIMLMTCMT